MEKLIENGNVIQKLLPNQIKDNVTLEELKVRD